MSSLLCALETLLLVCNWCFDARQMFCIIIQTALIFDHLMKVFPIWHWKAQVNVMHGMRKMNTDSGKPYWCIPRSNILLKISL